MYKLYIYIYMDVDLHNILTYRTNTISYHQVTVYSIYSISSHTDAVYNKQYISYIVIYTYTTI